MNPPPLPQASDLKRNYNPIYMWYHNLDKSEQTSPSKGGDVSGKTPPPTGGKGNK